MQTTGTAGILLITGQHRLAILTAALTAVLKQPTAHHLSGLTTWLAMYLIGLTAIGPKQNARADFTGWCAADRFTASKAKLNVGVAET